MICVCCLFVIVSISSYIMWLITAVLKIHVQRYIKNHLFLTKSTLEEKNICTKIYKKKKIPVEYTECGSGS